MPIWDCLPPGASLLQQEMTLFRIEGCLAHQRSRRKGSREAKTKSRTRRVLPRWGDEEHEEEKKGLDKEAVRVDRSE